MRLSRVLLVLCFATPSFAGVVDRQPLARPVGTLIDGGSGRVVASERDMFLVHGQRITTDGVKIDAEPLIGTGGFAVGWSDGWMIIDARVGAPTIIRHLTRAASHPDVFATVPSRGVFVTAASNGSRIAIVEREWNTNLFWITVTEDAQVIQQRQIARLDDATIAAFGDEFLMVSYVFGAGGGTTNAWRIHANGTPVQIETIGAYSQSRNIAVNGDRALVTLSSASGLVGFAFDHGLNRSEPITAIPPQGKYLTLGYPVATPRGFLISYSVNALEIGNRAVEIGLDRTFIQDSPAEPIAAADRIGDRYLVVRPWGDAAVAVGDPRLVAFSAWRLKKRINDTLMALDTVVSDGVTLVTYYKYNQYASSTSGFRFVRIDGYGRPIDADPVQLPGSPFAIPGGFGFVWKRFGDDAIFLRRLSARGDWIDSAPQVIGAASGAYSVSGNANENDVLLAWTTKDRIVWQRFDFDFKPLGTASSVTEIATDISWQVKISGRGRDRLLVAIQRDFPCYFECAASDIPLQVLAIGPSGDALGALVAVPHFRATLEGVGLPDGTWVLVGYESHSGGNLLHMSHQGSVLEITESRDFSQALDIAPTPLGWKAVATNPLRIVEFVGFDRADGVTGLSDMTEPRFAHENQLAFFQESPEEASAIVPTSGWLETIDGDLGVTLYRGTQAGTYVVAVRNKGRLPATNVVVSSVVPSFLLFGGRASVRIDRIEPQSTAFVDAQSVIARDVTIAVMSDDVRDVDPSDNFILSSAAAPAPRPHATRR